MYTLAANQITLSDGTVYDYCVAGDTLTLRDATDQSQFVLKRQ
jgi:hypothetical protein